MASAIEICNVALVRIGADMITSFDDANKAGRLCRLLYRPTLEGMLRAHVWNFSIRRAELAANTNTPVFGYTYEHPLPDDFMRLVLVDEDYGHRLETNADGQRVMLSDSETEDIEYVSYVSDPNLMDAAFRQALSLTLAVALCPAITENAAMTKILADEAREATALARTLDAQEGTPRDIEADYWVNARI